MSSGPKRTNVNLVKRDRIPVRSENAMTTALRAIFPEIAERSDKLLPVAEPYTKPTGKPGLAAAGDVVRTPVDVTGKTRDLRLPAEPTDQENTTDGRQRWRAPPAPLAPRPHNVQDLTGRPFGRMTVIGYHKSKAGLGALWLVRCVCGYYELRRSKAIVNSGAEQSCSECTRLEHLRWRASSEAPKESRAALEARFEALAAHQRNRARKR